MPQPTDPCVEARRAHRARVLLVNGEDASRSMLAQALAEQGITVDEASDAHDALEIVDYAPPDVVVYTLGWGAGLHELDELEAAVEEHGECPPAVVLSTPAWIRAQRGITLRGPAQIHELIAAIRRALREHEREATAWRRR